MRNFSPTRSGCLTLAFVIAMMAMMGITQLRAQSRYQSRHSYRSAQSPMRMRQGPVATRQGSAERPSAPEPIDRRNRPPQSLYPTQPGAQVRSQLAPIDRRNQPGRNGRGVHLGQWMSQHSNLTPQQQAEALEREPGFRSLSPQQQQRMRNHLAQLDAMPPDRRQREVAHIEMMERLDPIQRQEVRGAMKQLGSLPDDQRRAVVRSFRQLRGLPPDQRAAAANSGRYGWMNENQRSTLNNLLHIEPLLPPPGK